MIESLATLALGGGHDILAPALKAEESGASGVTRPESWLVDLTGGGLTAAGVRVNTESAMRISAYQCCVRVLAESIAMLPLIVNRSVGKGSEPAKSHPHYRLLHDSPNEWQTSFEWREMMMGHCVTRGNAYSYIQWNGRGTAQQLIPLNPDRVSILCDDDGYPWYGYTLPNGEYGLAPRQDILHLRGLSTDGYLGRSLTQDARESLGLTMAQEEHNARVFGNGTRLSGILTTAESLSQPKRDQMRAEWTQNYQGSRNAFKMAILEGGLRWESLGMSNSDAQLLQSREFQIGDIARWFRIPGIMIGHNDKSSTYASAEQFFLAFVVHTLMPWIVRWEQRLNKTLFVTDAHFPKFKVQGLVRGDIRSRYAAYAVGRQWGWLSADDIRELEDMNPLPEGGDIYLQPLNMVPAGYDPAATLDRKEFDEVVEGMTNHLSEFRAELATIDANYRRLTCPTAN